VQDAVNEIDAIQASLLRALASPQRLRLLHLLGDRPKEVNELARELELGQATVSQHLAAMRGVGLVEANRDGRSVRYRLTDPEILVACDLMRQVIGRRLSALGSLAAAAGYAPADPGANAQTSPPSSSTQVTHP
jgi:DNA-binding transcriptional ArsR family regulator